MADMSATIWTAILAKYTADTGASGLNNAASSAYVVNFVRRGDPNFDEARRANWPNVIVEIFNNESRVFGKRRVEVLVRMHLFTHRDTNTTSFTQQNAVGDRLYVLFDGTTLTTQGTVEFTLMHQVRDFQGPSSGIELHRVFEYTLQPIEQTAV